MVNEDSGNVMLRRSMLDYPNTASRFTVNVSNCVQDKVSNVHCTSMKIQICKHAGN